MVENCWDFCRFEGVNGDNINDCRLLNFRVSGIYNEGLRCRWAENVWLSEGMMNAGLGLAPNGLIRLSDGIQGLLATSVQVTGSSLAGLITSAGAGAISRGNDIRWSKFLNCIFDDSQTGLIGRNAAQSPIASPVANPLGCVRVCLKEKSACPRLLLRGRQ